MEVPISVTVSSMTKADTLLQFVNLTRSQTFDIQFHTDFSSYFISK